jgi:dTDP-glucose 4,6-dehydratase
MRLNDGRVLPVFIGHAFRGEDLTIFGANGKQTRSYCYVDDLMEEIYRLLHSDYAYPVNIGNPNEITMNDFAQEIIKLIGTNQKIEYLPLPQDDPKQRQPDITKATELLGGLVPKINRIDGLLSTYNYFKSLPRTTWDLPNKEFKHN